MSKKFSTFSSRSENRDTNKDQFYTKLDIIIRCIESSKNYVDQNIVKSCLDFSAGNNDFNRSMKIHYKFISSFYSVDIAPQRKEVTRKDFFRVSPFHVDLIGFNPPFGFKNNLVKRFLFHAAKFTPFYFMLILPCTNVYVYPPFYEEIYCTLLEKDAFYNPSSSNFSIANCKFVILKNNASFIYVKPLKQQELLFNTIKRFPQSRVSSWYENFTQGFAIKIHGTNTGKHIVLWNVDSGFLLDHFGKFHEIDFFCNHKGEEMSCTSFYTYQTTFIPSLKFIKTLWDEFALVQHIIQRRLTFHLDVVEVSQVIHKVVHLLNIE